MTGLTVVDSGLDDIAGRIVSGIRDYGGNPSDVRVVQAASADALRRRRPDILVMSEDASRLSGKASGRIRCGTLLLPGDVDAEMFEAVCIVTYGMSPKNTITLSSISEDSCVLAIQREILTVSGDMLDRQEMKIRGGMRPGTLLAVAGTLLLLGLRLSVP